MAADRNDLCSTGDDVPPDRPPPGDGDPMEEVEDEEARLGALDADALRALVLEQRREISLQQQEISSQRQEISAMRAIIGTAAAELESNFDRSSVVSEDSSIGYNERRYNSFLHHLHPSSSETTAALPSGGDVAPPPALASTGQQSSPDDENSNKVVDASSGGSGEEVAAAGVEEVEGRRSSIGGSITSSIMNIFGLAGQPNDNTTVDTAPEEDEAEAVGEIDDVDAAQPDANESSPSEEHDAKEATAGIEHVDKGDDGPPLSPSRMGSDDHAGAATGIEHIEDSTGPASADQATAVIEQIEDFSEPHITSAAAVVAGVDYIEGEDDNVKSKLVKEDAASKKQAVPAEGRSEKGMDATSTKKAGQSAAARGTTTTAGIESIDDADGDAVPFDSATYERDNVKRVAIPVGVAEAVDMDHETPDIEPDIANSYFDEESPPEGNAGNVSRDNMDDEVPPLRDAEPTAAQIDESDDVENSTILIPHAYIPEEMEGVEVVDAYAEPILPWYKQRNVRFLCAFVSVVVVAAAVAVGVSVSRSGQTTITQGILVSSAPSVSAAPSLKPSTSPPPSQLPSMLPSSSQVPSFSPTACSYKLSKTVQEIELPLNNPNIVIFEVSGKSAVAVAREGNSNSVHIVFYSLNESGEWTRNSIFIEGHDDFVATYVFKYNAAILGRRALVGLPQKNERAGLVREFEFNVDTREWEMLPEPLVPADGSKKGASFGHVVHFNEDDLALIGAHFEEAIYVFERVGGTWIQRVKYDVGYKIFGAYFHGNTLAGMNGYMSEINIYRYDGAANQVEVLQEPLMIEPRAREYGGMAATLEATGAAKQTSILRFDGRLLIHLVELGTVQGGLRTWVQEAVVIYKRQPGDDNFSHLQTLNSSSYEEGFGWEIIFDKDILVVSGNTNTYIFEERNGEFEEAFSVPKAFDRIRMSGRNIFGVTRAKVNDIQSMSLEECTQPWPTAMPSISLAPTFDSLSYLLPSSSPTISLVPTTTSSPTYECQELLLFILTQGAISKEEFEGDFISWKLYEQKSEEVIVEGGPLDHNSSYFHNLTCLESGSYTYEITSSRGSGFGACEGTGLCATAFFYGGVERSNIVGVLAGVIQKRWYQEKFTFTLPPFYRQPTVSGYDVQCINDFIIQILTDEWPEEISWELVKNETGQVVLSGGPYDLYNMIYLEYSCLEYGAYHFTIYDEGPVDPEAALGPTPGQYFIAVNGGSDFIFGGSLNFGQSQTATFVWQPPEPENITAPSNRTACLTEDECRERALAMGLQIGGVGYVFTGEYPTYQYGCHFYLNGAFAGHAYFGVNGTEEEMSTPSGGCFGRLYCSGGDDFTFNETNDCFTKFPPGWLDDCAVSPCPGEPIRER